MRQKSGSAQRQHFSGTRAQRAGEADPAVTLLETCSMEFLFESRLTIGIIIVIHMDN
jgi:hypothetical protein